MCQLVIWMPYSKFILKFFGVKFAVEIKSFPLLLFLMSLNVQLIAALRVMDGDRAGLSLLMVHRKFARNVQIYLSIVIEAIVDSTSSNPPHNELYT